MMLKTTLGDILLLILNKLSLLKFSYFRIQWNLYKAETIGEKQKCPFFRDVRFIEIPRENK